MDTQEELARRLVAGLYEFPARDTAAEITAAKDLAEITEHLYQQLTELPAETRQLLLTADSGFAAKGSWVDAAIEAQNQQMKKLTRAANMVASWHGDAGNEVERIFVIRGNIRGWAHRWRTEDKGPAQVDSDPDFVSFASGCLAIANVAGDHATLIAAALGSDWRTATR